MKNKYLKMIPWLIIIIIFTMVHFYQLKDFYDQDWNSSGLTQDDFLNQLNIENQHAIEGEQEYRKLLEDPGITQPGETRPTKQKDLKLHALSALLMDDSNKRILYEKNGYKRMPMASTTKIMTCIIALENAKLDEVVTISSYAARMPDVQLNVKPGEQYYLKDLLYSLMLESHNDVAVAIAEHVGGSVEGFATMMNDKARSLECMDTNFVTPNGLDAEGHYTTAKDLALISSYAIHNDQFIKITNTASHSFREVNGKRAFTVSNKNRFLYMMDGAIGIKTGFTNGAGYCFAGALKRPDRTLISVVLGCGWPPSKNLKWTDTKLLMNYGIENYKLKQIFVPMQFKPLEVKNGQQKWEKVILEGDLSLLLRDDELIDIEYDLPQVVEAPLKKGEPVGYARYYIDGNLYAELPIRALTQVGRINFKYCIDKIIKFWSLQY